MKVGLITDDALTQEGDLVVRKGTGVARYSQRLLHGLRAEGVSVEPIYVSPPRVPFGEALKHIFTLPRSVLMKAGAFDLVHAMSPIAGLSLPLTRTPKVVTYYDLISLLSKDANVPVYARASAPLFLRVGRYCDRIIAVSTQTKAELVAHLDMPAEKITVINSGIDERFRPLARNGRKEHHVIGYLGALSSSKRVDYLIRAFHHLRKRHPQLDVRLCICGSKGRQLPTLKELGQVLNLSDVVEFRGFIPDEELVETYNSFDVFVLPSEWEGFGLPILEAQRCAVPVIVREDAHIPVEVSACCLKAASQEDMADKIYELLTNENLRQATIEQGLEHSQQFTWERTVQDTLKVYEQAVA